MKLEEPIHGMDCHKVAATFHAFDGHSFVMRRGLVHGTTGSANSIEHHNF